MVNRSSLVMDFKLLIVFNNNLLVYKTFIAKKMFNTEYSSRLY